MNQDTHIPVSQSAVRCRVRYRRECSEQQWDRTTTERQLDEVRDEAIRAAMTLHQLVFLSIVSVAAHL